MSSDPALLSRPSNGSNPALDVSAPNAADLKFRSLPTPEERVNELLRKYPDRAFVPVSRTDGQKLRRECFEDPETQLREVEVGENEMAVVEDVLDRSALPLVAVVEEFLEWYESYRDKSLRMARGMAGTPEYEWFDVPLETSWGRAYNSREYARLKAIEREVVGGERPSGGVSEGAFEEPATLMVTRSSSSLDGDSHRPIVDHDREIADAWTQDNGVRRRFRYIMQDKLGLSREEYIFRRQGEPHPGSDRKAAAGYGHEHLVVIFDAAKVRPSLLRESTFRPLIEKHLELAGFAQRRAHGEKAVELKRVGDGDGEVSNLATYVAKYIACDPEQDLLERPIEYIMWAASQWAAGTQKFTQSNVANNMADADACKQRFEDPEAEQSRRHGEMVVRSSRQGYDFECACCGSPWQVDQSAETLVEARRESSVEEPEEPSLESRWPDARAGAVVGEPTHEAGEEVESVRESFERPRSWRAEAIVEGGEVTPIGSSGGSVMLEVVVGQSGPIPPEKCVPPWKLRCPDPLGEHGLDPTEYPPPELIEEQLAESRPLSEKKWPVDWHEMRYGPSDASVVEVPEEPVPQFDEAAVRRQVERLVETEPDLSVVAVMGRLMLPPEAREVVASVVGDGS